MSWHFLIAIYQTGINLILNLGMPEAFDFAGGWTAGAIGGAFGGAGSGIYFSAGHMASHIIISVMRFFGPIQATAVVVTVSVVFLASLAVGIIIRVIAFARAFEIAIYCAISPIPVSFLPLEDNGGSRITKNFFLNFAAVVFQGVLIVIILQIYNIFSSEIIFSFFDTATTLANKMYSEQAWWHSVTGPPRMGEAFILIIETTGALLLCILVLIMAILKSGQMAKSIFNAS
ncbi:MAG: hypothetical protein FWG44_08000 [Oscillospiraceae bacterium]|nr:hypothetical protein [Oscillospiraceae bacterium]